MFESDLISGPTYRLRRRCACGHLDVEWSSEGVGARHAAVTPLQVHPQDDEADGGVVDKVEEAAKRGRTKNPGSGGGGVVEQVEEVRPSEGPQQQQRRRRKLEAVGR
nr:unnamed protein product [Digitaria exilis]